MTDIKANILLLVAFTILLLSVYNHLTDNNEMHEHHEFFGYMKNNSQQMQKFMARGGRNTAAMGLELCKHLNDVKTAVSQNPVLCKEIYK